MSDNQLNIIGNLFKIYVRESVYWKVGDLVFIQNCLDRHENSGKIVLYSDRDVINFVGKTGTINEILCGYFNELVITLEFDDKTFGTFWEWNLQNVEH